MIRIVELMYLHIMKAPASRLTSHEIPLPCACATLRRATRAVTQAYNRAFEGSGLEVTQFTFLQVMATAGELTQGRMAALLAIDSTTLSRSLKPLEKAGWIASRAGADRRERILRLTVAGRKMLEQALPVWRGAQEQLRKRLGDAAWNLMMLSADLATGASR